jgi:hypothetical protein
MRVDFYICVIENQYLQKITIQIPFSSLPYHYKFVPANYVVFNLQCCLGQQALWALQVVMKGTEEQGEEAFSKLCRRAQVLKDFAPGPNSTNGIRLPCCNCSRTGSLVLHLPQHKTGKILTEIECVELLQGLPLLSICVIYAYVGPGGWFVMAPVYCLTVFENASANQEHL